MTDSEVVDITEGTLETSAPPQPHSTGRALRSGLSAEARAAVGGYRQWKMARWAAQLEQIESIGKQLAGLRDDELRKRSLALRYQAKAGDKPGGTAKLASRAEIRRFVIVNEPLRSAHSRLPWFRPSGA